MTTNIFILILLVHYLADFALQTHKQAIEKGEGDDLYNESLMEHVVTYSLVWLVFTCVYTGQYWHSIIFTFVTFILHYTTDWITSRMSKPLFKNGDYHNGFCIVGADQLAHYIQLIITYNLLFL